MIFSCVMFALFIKNHILEKCLRINHSLLILQNKSTKDADKILIGKQSINSANLDETAFLWAAHTQLSKISLLYYICFSD